MIPPVSKDVVEKGKEKECDEKKNRIRRRRRDDRRATRCGLEVTRVCTRVEWVAIYHKRACLAASLRDTILTKINNRV